MTLTQQKECGLLWIGDIKRSLGEVMGNSYIDVVLTILPIKTGNNIPPYNVRRCLRVCLTNMLAIKEFSPLPNGQESPLVVNK